MILFELEAGTNSDMPRVTLETLQRRLESNLAPWRSAHAAYIAPVVQEVLELLGSTLDDSRTNMDLDDFSLAEKDPHGLSMPLNHLFVGRPSRSIPTGHTSASTPHKRKAPPAVNASHPGEWEVLKQMDIFLPSSYPPSVQAHPLMTHAVLAEKKIREGQANDALTALRTEIITGYELRLEKQKHSGQIHQTRTKAKVTRKRHAVNCAARTYRRARAALVSLGMTPEQRRLFKQLDDSHLTPFTLSNSHRKLGESRTEVSWIWEDLSFVSHSDNQGMEEYLEEGEFLHIHINVAYLNAYVRPAFRVHWFRKRALRARWWEEQRLTIEEMTRTVRFFKWHKRDWEVIAERYDDDGKAGRAAHARK